MDDVIDGMACMSKLSSLKHPHTGVARLLQLLSVKSHTREQTPHYFVAFPNNSTCSNIVMMQFRGGMIQKECLFFCSGTLLLRSLLFVYYCRQHHARL